MIVGYNQEQAYRLFVDGDGFGLQHVFGDLCVPKRDQHGDHLELYTTNGIRKIYYKGGGKSDSHKAITGYVTRFGRVPRNHLLHMDMIQECFRRTFASKDVITLRI